MDKRGISSLESKSDTMKGEYDKAIADREMKIFPPYFIEDGDNDKDYNEQKTVKGGDDQSKAICFQPMHG